MNRKTANFLSEEDLKNLDLYEYHGGEYSYIDNLLNPFWLKVAYAFPNWFAPNLITLTGLAINVIASLLIAFYDPMLIGEAPSWVYFNAAICLQIYATLDAADGKQARRLNVSSPMGQIFDHGCDAINLIFIIISCCSGIGLGLGKTTSLCIVLICSCFAAAQLLEYQTNILVAGSKVFGVTETMLIISGTLILTSFVGPAIYDIDMVPYMPFLAKFKSVVKLKYLLFSSLLTAILLTCFIFLMQGLVKDCPIPEEKRGNKNVTRKDYLVRFFPIFVIGACGLRLLNSDIMNEYSLYICFLCGLTFSFLSIRINVSHLCRRRLTYKFVGMYPILALAINDIVKIVPNNYMVPWCFFFMLAFFTVFIITTLDQIKTHLHIRTFHVQSKME